MTLLVPLLGGCGSSSPEDAAGHVGPPNPSLDSYTFGQTHVDGIDVKVDNFILLDPEKAAEFAQPGDPPAEWSIDLTYTNNTDAPVHPAMMQVLAGVDRDDEELVLVFEWHGADRDGAIPPGATVTVPVAFTGSGKSYVVSVLQPDSTSMARFSIDR
ncbi:MAG: hypothetical protein ACRDQ7_03575 [Haloechinothrix sp.]